MWEMELLGMRTRQTVVPGIFLGSFQGHDVGPSMRQTCELYLMIWKCMLSYHLIQHDMSALDRSKSIAMGFTNRSDTVSSNYKVGCGGRLIFEEQAHAILEILQRYQPFTQMNNASWDMLE